MVKERGGKEGSFSLILNIQGFVSRESVIDTQGDRGGGRGEREEEREREGARNGLLAVEGEYCAVLQQGVSRGT